MLPEDELRPIRYTQMGYPESSSDHSFYDIAAPARCAGAALTLFRTSGSVKDVVGRSLRLCGGVNQKLAIIAQLLEPAGDIGGLITNDRV